MSRVARRRAQGNSQRSVQGRVGPGVGPYVDDGDHPRGSYPTRRLVPRSRYRGDHRARDIHDVTKGGSMGSSPMSRGDFRLVRGVEVIDQTRANRSELASIENGLITRHGSRCSHR